MCQVQISFGILPSSFTDDGPDEYQIIDPIHSANNYLKENGDKQSSLTYANDLTNDILGEFFWVIS